jgi:hypothetical protein
VSSVTRVQSSASRPADTRSPAPQVIGRPPTRTLARPPAMLSNTSGTPNTSAEEPRPPRVTEHDEPVQDTRLTVRDPEDDELDAEAEEDDEAEDDDELPPLHDREPPPAQLAVQAVVIARTSPGSRPGRRKRLRRLMTRGDHTAATRTRGPVAARALCVVRPRPPYRVQPGAVAPGRHPWPTRGQVRCRPRMPAVRRATETSVVGPDRAGTPRGEREGTAAPVAVLSSRTPTRNRS